MQTEPKTNMTAGLSSGSASTDRGFAQYPDWNALIAPRVASPLYVAELNGLLRQRDRAKAAGDDTTVLTQQIDVIGQRAKFYAAVIKGYNQAKDMPARPWDHPRDYEYFTPPETVVPPETVTPVAVMPKLDGTIMQVGEALAALKPKAVKLILAKEGTAFAVVKQTPAAGAALPPNGQYSLTLQPAKAWTADHAVLMRMIFRLAPEWLALGNYKPASDAATEAIAKVIKTAEMARVKSDAKGLIEHWVPLIVKASAVEIKPAALKAALTFTVPYLT